MTQTAFAHTLQNLRDGRVHAELSTSLSELLHKVQETGKAGELTLKIKIKPATRGNVDKVMISDQISLNLPKPERGEDVFYLTDDCDLSRNHPRQASLELREVNAPTPSTNELKKVG
jgi:hypothetical protein